MNVLDKILAHKKLEVVEQKKLISSKLLEDSKYFHRPVFSLKEFILRDDKSGIITEFKRKSPSKGIINSNASIVQTTTGYVQAGASALSILTDNEFFGGSKNDLIAAREVNLCPILRKDFVLDEYQILEAKSIGADAVLLIVAALNLNELRSLHTFAKSLGLEVLVEVHNEDELKLASDCGCELIGVNNRNLKTFEVDINISKKLSRLIPNEVIKISESGINSVETIIELKKFGYRGFLMGENFMKENQPEIAAKKFMKTLMERSA